MKAFSATQQLTSVLDFGRLSVLDHDGGKQPMQTGDGTLTIVFNGEIYNHRELRMLLESKGHQFKSDHSDTEVLLHGYREWGDGLPEHLNGMFAFAIYDKPRQRLFMARDRFGEKPVFIHHENGLFAFSSELESLLAHDGVTPAWDRSSLQKYFAYGYFPAPHTPYKSVREAQSRASAYIRPDKRSCLSVTLLGISSAAR